MDPLTRTELQVLDEELIGLPQGVRRRFFLLRPTEGAGIGATSVEAKSGALCRAKGRTDEDADLDDKDALLEGDKDREELELDNLLEVRLRKGIVRRVSPGN